MRNERKVANCSCFESVYKYLSATFLYLQAVKQGYENEPVVQTLYPKPVSFTPAWNMKLSLDLKREGVFIDGWKIIPVTFPAEVGSYRV